MSNTATLSYSWSQKGRQPLIDYKQKKRERQTAFGSLDIRTGKVTVNFADKGNYQTFKNHLKKVLWEYRHSTKIIMILDNARFHHAKLLKPFLQNHHKPHFIYLPAYSPDLNPIERVWWYMRKKITHNRLLLSLAERKIKFWKLFSLFQKNNDEIIRICAIHS